MSPIKKPLFTIITVCLNDIESLKHTYMSIAEQSYGLFDWVVIDGGSGDGSVEYLQELGKPNINWLSEPDAGLYDAMNKGIPRASGDYLLFLNAGDYLDSADTLSKVAKRLTEVDPPDLIYGDAIYLYEGKKDFFKKARGPKYFKYGIPTCHQAIFYKRKAISDTRYRPNEFSIGADYAFTAEFLMRNHSILQVSFPICQFTAGGVSSENRTLILRDIWCAQRDILGLSYAERSLSFIIHFMTTLTSIYTPWIYRKIHRLHQSVYK